MPRSPVKREATTFAAQDVIPAGGLAVAVPVKTAAVHAAVRITDLFAQGTEPIHELMWSRYGECLAGQGGSEYRTKVFDYTEQEDSPQPVTYQLDLLRRVGFPHVELLHKNSCFAAFGAWKE